MNRYILFDHLKKQSSSELLKLLQNCFDGISAQQKREFFGHLEREYIENTNIDGEFLLKEIKIFKEESLRGVYYAPFDINSKNYMNVPEETDMWFEKLAELLIESSQLSKQADHVNAIKCFELLFECISEMHSGKEIIFADEYGMWMLPIAEEPCINAYITSAATLLNPEEYTKAVLSLIAQDSHESFYNKVYQKAKRAASEEQKVMLEEKVTQHKIRTS